MCKSLLYGDLRPHASTSLIFSNHSSSYHCLQQEKHHDNHERELQKLIKKVVNVGPFPMQTFFLPMPEELVYNTIFKEINSVPLKPPVQSMFSVSISVDNTIIWYDHWEDGYEVDVTKPNSTTTEVWGDRNATNGCQPGIKVPCTDASDVLFAGDSIVKQNAIEIPRTRSLIRYDGGDKIMSSFGVSVTRGCFPQAPGSVMAGAVDVVETDVWGMEFIAPVGTDVAVAQGAFELAAFYFMAAYDNTTVTLPTGKKVMLNSGETSSVVVTMGYKLVSDKKIQVVFVGGDKDSSYELRWFSYLDTKFWSNEYVSPIGDTFSETKIILYNANSFDVSVTLFTRNITAVSSTIVSEVLVVKSKKFLLTRYIPTGSGAKVQAPKGQNFVALSISDTNVYTGTGADKVATGGQW